MQGELGVWAEMPPSGWNHVLVLFGLFIQDQQSSETPVSFHLPPRL